MSTSRWYFNDEAVKVDWRAARFGSESFPMSDILSAKVFMLERSKANAVCVLWGFAALGAWSGNSKGDSFLAAVFFLAGLWVLMNPPIVEYAVTITTTTGEKRPLQKRDQSYVEKIVLAINEAAEFARAEAGRVKNCQETQALSLNGASTGEAVGSRS